MLANIIYFIVFIILAFVLSIAVKAITRGVEAKQVIKDEKNTNFNNENINSEVIDQIKELNILDDLSISSGFYLRLRVSDRPGVLADITRELSNENVSIDVFFQKKPLDGEDSTDVVLLTNVCSGAGIFTAIDSIKNIKSVIDDPVVLRVESLE